MINFGSKMGKQDVEGEQDGEKQDVEGMREESEI